MSTFQSRFKELNRRVPIDEHNVSVQFDVTKCKNCTLVAEPAQIRRVSWIIIICPVRVICLFACIAVNVLRRVPLAPS